MAANMNRRGFVGLAGAMALSTAFGGRVARAEGERLRLLYWGGQPRANVTNQASELFTKESGIAIQSEFLSWGDYWQKLATQVAGGDAPDIVQMDYRYIVEYADRGVIAALDDYVGNQLKLDDFDEDQIAGGRVNGKLCGISLGANSAAMLVNTSAFEAAGLAVPDRNTTYEDLFAYAEAFKKTSPRDGMRVIDDTSGSEPMLENWLRQQGKALYTSDGKLAFDASDATKWFQLWSELRKAGVCITAENQALAGNSEATAAIVTGYAALQPANSNRLLGYQALMQDKLTMVPFPRIAPGATGGHYRKPSMFFSVSDSSQSKEAAAEFISFFVNDIEAAKIMTTERGIPCSAAARKALMSVLDEDERISVDYVSSLGDLLGPIPPAPPKAAGEIETSVLGVLSQQVAFDMMSPEQAANELVSQASELLSRG